MTPFDDLPELTLSLRSFGSRRGMRHGSVALPEDQDRFFAPLLDGRRRAAQAVSRPQVVAAFEPRRLTALVDATIRAFASARFAKRAPARRAFEAELFELVEPLRESLQVLRALTEALPLGQGAVVPDESWNDWLTQLRVVFHVADSSWPPLRDALAAAAGAVPEPRGWRFPRGRGDRR